MKVTRRVGTQGRITLPPEIEEYFGLEPGDFVEIDVRPVEEGEPDP